MSGRSEARWAQWLIGAAAVACAWAASVTTPGIGTIQAPFPVPARIGETAVGRNFEITVTAIHSADSVSSRGFRGKTWTAAGTWVVVDLTLAARVKATSLQTAILTIDGRSWSVSERPDSLRNELVEPGIARTGSLAFELPRAARSGVATLRLGTGLGGNDLDSELRLPVDLGALPVENSVPVRPNRWAGP